MAAVILYRIFCAFVVLVGSYLHAIVSLLCGAYLMLRFTRLYREFTRGPQREWPRRPKRVRYIGKLFGMIFTLILISVLSIIIGLFYNQIVNREEPVKIIAHRGGGTLAPENSLDGLRAAISHDCYASEIDIHRTKDGYYIVNHDNTFQRLFGINKAPKDMTLEEIKELRIEDDRAGETADKDAGDTGHVITVATLEEMLDTVKGREKLFIELKGATADRRMVDDVVQIVRERDCVSDVALISLTYDIIDYAETTYPEFETGVLFFAGLGNVARLNCDLLIMEEESATPLRISEAHAAGKQALAWTVNTESGLYSFLDSSIDGIITDEIELAEQVQKILDARSVYKVLQDKLDGFFGNSFFSSSWMVR